MAKISVVLPGYPAHAGGGYKVVYQYANFLAQAGHRVHLVQMRPDQLRDLTPAPVRRTVRTLIYALGRHARPRWFPLDKRITVTNYARQAAEYVPVSDAVVATAMETAHVASLAAEQQSIPGVYFIQHYELWSDDPSYVDSTWRLPLRKIVIAPWLQQKAADLGETAVVVPNAIDANAFPLGPLIADRPMQILGLVSDLGWKRTDLLAETMELVAAEMPGVVLKTFGVVDKPSVLSEGVLHTRSPRPEDLRTLYQDSRVFLCTSDSEGFGLPPAEAMASGATVVSTDIGGVRSYADGVALFSPVGNARSLADNVLRLLRDPALAQQLATSGRERIAAYSPSAAATAFEREILCTLTNGADS
jgi:glycosyltransferase involved in cell wall biosynthesis